MATNQLKQVPWEDLQGRVTAEGRLRVFFRGSKVTLALIHFHTPPAPTLSKQSGVRKAVTWYANSRKLTATQQAAFERQEPETPSLFLSLRLTEEV